MTIPTHWHPMYEHALDPKAPFRVFVSTSSFGKHDPEPLRLLRQHRVAYELNPFRRRLGSHEIVDFIRDVDGLIAGTEPLTRDVLAQAKRLKVISRCGTGLDNVDLEAAAELGIVVTNTPYAHIDAVAELTLGAILALIRNIPHADRDIRQGKWHKSMGQLLKGSNVGIVGLGNVGRRLAELLEPFEPRLTAYDPQPDTSFAVAHRIRMETLEDLLQCADIVTVHVPYSAATHRLLDRKRLALMKPGSYIVNTSRGGIIDEEALYDFLRQGWLEGAYIDTFVHEPYNGPLAQLHNTLLTPHIGSYAKESRIRMEIEAVENLLASVK